MVTQIPTRYLNLAAHGKIAYDVQGSGPLLVLAPGMGELRSTYRFLAPTLVAAGYTVATTDLRGHGESNTAFSSYGDVETAADMEALLVELAEPAVVVGNSMSAGSAVILAATRPELVSALVLIGPFVRDPANSGFQNLLFRILMARPWAVASWKAFLPTLYSGNKPADFAEYHRSVIASMKRAGYGQAFRLTTRTSHAVAEASLAAVTAPSLVVMGEKDPDFKDPRAEAEWVAHALNGSVTMVPDAGHYPQSQQPDLVSTAMLSFLAAVGSRG